VPILKGRQGEIDALKSVQLRTRQAMLPLVELAPKDEVDTAATVAKNCRQTVEKLGKTYQHPVMLDAGLFDLNAAVDGQRGAVALVTDTARGLGMPAQPVLRLGDPVRAVREAAAAHVTDGRGLTIRLVGEDLDEDPDDLDAALQGVLNDTRTTRALVDLVLDVGPVDGDFAVRGGARLVVSLLRDLPKIGEWRSVTVTSGAFPVDLSQFTPNVIGERPRYDAQLFDQVRHRKLPRQPDFGDYGVAHPGLAVGGAYSPPPQVRYTAAEHWLVLKGRRNDPRGHTQFHRICSIIAGHPEFAGTPVGAADQRIAAGSPEGAGNGTTWRMIGTTHHLDYVTMRLTTLGEP
jgi:hypothetical protein